MTSCMGVPIIATTAGELLKDLIIIHYNELQLMTHDHLCGG